MKKDTLALVISIVGIIVMLIIVGVGFYLQYFR